eukprot:scaffold361_cov265-Chaetoceros_neogracile.AAC.34
MVKAKSRLLKSSSTALQSRKRRCKSHSIVSIAAAASALAMRSPSPVTSAFVTPSVSLSSTVIPSLISGKTSKYFARKKLSAVKDEPDTASTENEKKPVAVATTKPKKEDQGVERTQSFAPQRNADKNIPIHTLIVGTHPSITSLAKGKSFAHPQNAFWWIAGDCLGFRRSVGISPSTGKYYKITEHVLEGEDKVVPYEEQMEVFTSKGFALWDILQSCKRKGSLDNDIKDEIPNAIQEFCDENQTIQRIIMANGMKQCSFFNKHFGQWWLDGELIPGKNELSQNTFKKWSKKTNGFENKNGKRQIEVYCMPGVSPAAASVSYEKKREAFQCFCYEPGLADHERLKISPTIKSD